MIVDIVTYPIRSCPGLHLAKAEIGPTGIVDDRKWSVFLDGESIGQLQEQRLLLLQPSFKYTSQGVQSHLVLSYPGFSDCLVETNGNKGSDSSFSLWNASGKFNDEGEEVAAWLFEVFGKKYRLGRITELRSVGDIVDFKGKGLDQHELTFAGEGHVLVIAQESFEEMKQYLPASVKNKVVLSSFRPNIVVKNARAYDEDTWGKFLINNIFFEGTKKCDRCRMTTIDTQTLQFENNCEPLNTLRKVHGDGIKGYLGLIAVRTNSGHISIGDTIVVNTRVVRK